MTPRQEPSSGIENQPDESPSNPGRIILVQEGETSADPTALAKVLDGSGIAEDVHTVNAADPPAYLHAKFFIAQLVDEEICLQGSANLSLAALTLVPPNGNIELVNLQRGARGAFHDAILAGLTVDPARPLDSIKLAYREPTRPVEPHLVHVVRAELHSAALHFQMSRPLQSPGSADLALGDQRLAATLDGAVASLALPRELAAWLRGRAWPLVLTISEAGAIYDTNAVYAAQDEELAKLLVGRRDPESLRRIGHVDIGVDDDIREALSDLEAALVIDRRSLWRVARPGQRAADEPPDGPPMRWADIDWDLVRRHPSLAQYAMLAAGRTDPTDVQLLLSAISDHLPTNPGAAPASPPPSDEDGDADGDAGEAPGDEDELLTDEEIAAREALLERRRRTIDQRNRQAWTRFFTRMVNGLEDDEFIATVGRVTATVNAMILDGLMTKVIARLLVDHDKVVPIQLRLWQRLWGGAAPTATLLDDLDSETYQTARDLLAVRHAALTTLIGLYLAERATYGDDWWAERVTARGLLRALVTHPLAGFEPADLIDAATLGGLDAADMALRLYDLAYEAWGHEAQEAVAAALHIPPGHVHWASDEVMVADRRPKVDYLDCHGDVALSADTATQALAAWVAADPHRGYWRVRASKTVAFLDGTTGGASYFDRASFEDAELDIRTVPTGRWVSVVDELLALTEPDAASA